MSHHPGDGARPWFYPVRLVVLVPLAILVGIGELAEAALNYFDWRLR